MAGEPSDFDPQDIWQTQATEQTVMTIAELHEKARTFEAKVRRRNTREYIAGAFVIAAFLPLVLLQGSWMIQVGAGLEIAASIFVLWQLHRRASAETISEAGEALTTFYRRQLIRQRDAVRSVGVWYIAPFLPGMAMILLGRWFQSHAPHRSLEIDHLIIILSMAVVMLVMLSIWLLNRRAARRLQHQIDQLG